MSAPRDDRAAQLKVMHILLDALNVVTDETVDVEQKGRMLSVVTEPLATVGCTVSRHLAGDVELNLSRLLTGIIQLVDWAAAHLAEARQQPIAVVLLELRSEHTDETTVTLLDAMLDIETGLDAAAVVETLNGWMCLHSGVVAHSAHGLHVDLLALTRALLVVLVDATRAVAATDEREHTEVLGGLRYRVEMAEAAQAPDGG